MAKKRAKKNEVEIRMADVAEVSGEALAAPTEGELAVMRDELDQALAEIEAKEAIAEVHADEAAEVEPAPASETAQGDWDTIIGSFYDEVVTDCVNRIASCMDERVAFELEKNPDNDNIQRTLKKARADMVTKRAAKVFLATNVKPEILNRTLHEGSRYNVYAIGKLADVIKGLTDGTVANAINVACLKSLFRFKAAGLTFTGEMAKAAASDKIRITDRNLAAALVRHTVSASTAPTQASSTMQALETLGIVRREGSHRNPTFTLTDHPAVAKLESLLSAA